VRAAGVFALSSPTFAKWQSPHSGVPSADRFDSPTFSVSLCVVGCSSYDLTILAGSGPLSTIFRSCSRFGKTTYDYGNGYSYQLLQGPLLSIDHNFITRPLLKLCSPDSYSLRPPSLSCGRPGRVFSTIVMAWPLAVPLSLPSTFCSGTSRSVPRDSKGRHVLVCVLFQRFVVNEDQSVVFHRRH
jgi:hypothetical protein